MPSNESPASISEESVSNLDDVCKGKPRRFVVLCKGPAIVSLVVYKTGTVGKHIKEAKEAGNGTVSYGVVDGKGQKINFKLSRADGFEKEPTTTTKLKSFLKDSADRTITSPVFEIVDRLEPLLDPDDPLVARYLKIQAAVSLACDESPAHAAEFNALCLEIGTILDSDAASDEAQAKIVALEAMLSSLAHGGGPQTSTVPPATPNASVPPALDPEAIRFAQRLKPLKPNLDKVLAANVPVSPAAQQTFAHASQAFKQQDFPAAHLALDGLEPLIKQGLEELAAKAFASGDPAALFNERLKALLPQIKAATGTPAGDEAKLKASEAGVFARGRDFTQAAKLLDELESVLKRGQPTPLPRPEESTTPTPTSDDLEMKWRVRFGAIEPRYQNVIQTQPANAGELRAVMDFANGLAEKGDFAKAGAALTRLETLLESAHTLGKETDVIPEGLVKQTVELLERAAGRWRGVRFQSIEGLESLMKELRADHDPDLHEIADRVNVVANEIPAEIEASLAKLSAAVRAADAGETERWLKQVQGDVEKCEDFLIDNLPYIERCEDNPFDVPVMIQTPLRETLANIRVSLANL